MTTTQTTPEHRHKWSCYLCPEYAHAKPRIAQLEAEIGALLEDRDRLRAALIEAKASLLWATGGWRPEGLPLDELRDAQRSLTGYLVAIDAALSGPATPEANDAR